MDEIPGRGGKVVHPRLTTIVVAGEQITGVLWTGCEADRVIGEIQQRDRISDRT